VNRLAKYVLVCAAVGYLTIRHSTSHLRKFRHQINHHSPFDIWDNNDRDH
jgi:hypothetical protein